MWSRIDCCREMGNNSYKNSNKRAIALAQEGMEALFFLDI